MSAGGPYLNPFERVETSYRGRNSSARGYSRNLIASLLIAVRHYK